jgi:uncharacterized membrane protein YjjP (DUF1212 family)
MGTYSKILLSGSSNGQAVPVTGTAVTVHTVIHTGITDTGSGFDEIYVYAHNTATTKSIVQFVISTAALASSVTAQIFGYELTAGGDIAYTGGLILVVPGLPVNNAMALLGWCTAVGRVNTYGYVHRYAS